MPTLREAQFRQAAHYEAVMRHLNELYLEGGPALTLGLSLLDLEWQSIRLGRSWAEMLSTDGDDAALAGMELS